MPPWTVLRSSTPTELAHGVAVIPDLGHVPDTVTVELHDIDVIRLHSPGRGRYRPSIASMGTPENGKAHHLVAVIVVSLAQAWPSSGNTTTFPGVSEACQRPSALRTG